MQIEELFAKASEEFEERNYQSGLEYISESIQQDPITPFFIAIEDSSMHNLDKMIPPLKTSKKPSNSIISTM